MGMDRCERVRKKNKRHETTRREGWLGWGAARCKGHRVGSVQDEKHTR